MLRYFFLGLTLLVAAAVLIIGPRGQQTRNRPIEVFPDMDHQPKFQPQHASPFFADGRAAREAVPGTVPSGFTQEGIYSQNAASNSPVKGGSGFANRPDYYHTGRIGDKYGDGIPLQGIGMELMARGQERYGIFCAVCHGAAGEGNGITSKYGMVGAASFHQGRLRDMPDGQIFNTITHGKNTMAGYGGNIAVEDRWAIIAYIRALQRSQNGALADVPEAERAALGGAKP
jgi:hypothetical protein